MKRGIKTQLANATGKSVSFICQYFKKKKRMSWDTALMANKAYPMVETELWMNQELTKIELRLTNVQAQEAAK